MLGEDCTRTLKPTLLHIGGLFTAAVLATISLITARPELAVLAGLCAFDGLRRSASSIVVNRVRPHLDNDGVLTGSVECAGTGPVPDALSIRASGVSGIPDAVVVAAHAYEGETWGRKLDALDSCGRSGPLDLMRTEVRAQTPRGALGPIQLLPMRIYAPPQTSALPVLPRPRRLVGAWGPREDRRAGSGTRFFDVAPLGRGDRLSRISWRSTARHATGADIDQIFIARNHAGSESIVMIALDPRDDVGRNVDAWAGGSKRSPTAITSLDVARNAAVSLAQAHLAEGDRVGLVDLSNPGHGLPPGTGRRTAERISRYVTTARPPHRATRQVRAPRIAPTASIWLISTLLDDVPVDFALHWAHTGHDIRIIDVLPEGLVSHDKAVSTALELELAERQLRIRALRETGIDVLSWRQIDEPDLAAFLQARNRGERR